MSEAATRMSSARFVCLGAIAGLATLAFAVVAAGGGHGTFIPLLALHPWAAIAANIEDGPVSGFIVGALEWPLYSAALHVGYRIGNVASIARIVALVHLLGIVIAARLIWGYGGH